MLLLAVVACPDDESTAPDDTDTRPSGAAAGPGTSRLATRLTSGTGFWFQPDFVAAINQGVLGTIRTHAVFVFRADGTGRRQTILLQPNGFTPTGGTPTMAYGWRTSGTTAIALQFTFPGQSRAETITMTENANGSLTIRTNNPVAGSNGSGLWWPCQREGCSDRLFGF